MSDCKGRWTALLCASGLSLAAWVLPAAAPAEQTATEEILAILQERGLIDDAEHARLLAKHRKESRSLPPVAAALEKVEFSGDLRLRYEAFRHQHDPTGVDVTDRDRMRYRARLSLKVPINDRIEVGMRLASGEAEPRSANQTLGSGRDFDTDDIRLDHAYAEIGLPTGSPLEAKLVAGKLSNPFRWGVGQDLLVWDGDISPEGGVLRLKLPAAEGLELFANAGYFVSDENTSSSDPKVIPLQLGATGKLGGGASFGLRSSLYLWRSLDASFVDAAIAQGNLCSAFDACTPGSTASDDDGQAHVGELSAYLELAGERWPVAAYGTYVTNFTADSEVVTTTLGPQAVGAEDTAWLVGLEVGDKTKFAKLGFAYGRVEANSVIATMTDSDLVDGFTNRRGWVAYLSRNLLPQTDLNFTLFRSDAIQADRAGSGCQPDCGAFTPSLVGADRYRFRTDLQLKF